MVPYYKGGWVAKRYAHFIDPILEKSKYGDGLFTQRGFN